MKRIICFILSAVMLAAVSAGCRETGEPDKTLTSLSDIPGITEDDIRAVDGLREKYDSFVYGMLLSTEAFINHDGNIDGYSVLFCEWLTELFGIPFMPATYEWGDMLAKMESGEIHFSGELTANEERRKTYSMTDPIAQRTVKYMRIAGSEPLSAIAERRPLRYAFLEDSTTADDVSDLLEGVAFEKFFADGYDTAYSMLKSGEIDAFFEESTAEAAFDIYGDVVADDFFPIIYSPVSLATRNPELEPIIVIVEQALKHGALPGLIELYNSGHRKYIKNKLFLRFTGDERRYIAQNPKIKLLAEHNNYPVSFYSTHDNEWQGIAIDALKEIERQTGLTFEIVNGETAEWPELMRMLENGEAALITEMIRSADREGRFLWPDTAVMSDSYALISKLEHRNINANEILYAKIGLIKDTGHTAQFYKWFPGHMNTETYGTSDLAFDALGRGEVDLVMGSQNLLLVLTNYNEHPGYKANFVFEQGYEVTFGLNSKEHILRSIISKSLRMTDTDAISKMWTRKTYDYRAKLAQTRTPWIVGATSLVLVLIFMFFVMFFVIYRKRREGKYLEEQVAGRTADLNNQQILMRVVNDAAALMLKSDAEDYVNAINLTMEMIGQYIDVGRICLWRNKVKDDGLLYYESMCALVREGLPPNENVTDFSYRDTLPGWEAPLSRGESISRAADDFLEEERLLLEPLEVKSFLAVPLFLKGEFWGFATLNDCRRPRVFGYADEYILRSWGLLAVGAIERGRIALNMRHTLTTLETVIGNYKGIIWSADADGVITTFDGQLLKSLGIAQSDLEGKTFKSARQFIPQEIIENADKTLSEGNQEWMGEFDGRMLHSNTAPMYDGGKRIIGAVGSIDDITELIKLQRDLEDALAAAEAAVVAAETSSRAKSAFLANMSHEIRTPMNSIIGFSELALGDEIPDKTREFVGDILQNATWLLQILNDILDISKIESGKIAVEIVPFDLGEILSHCEMLITPKALEKNIELRFHADKIEGKRLLGDPTRLRQVLINLIGNSIKFTHYGSVRLTSSVKEIAGDTITMCFQVRDSGIGMSKEQAEKIFEPFVQADVSTTRKYGGTGLGLAITKSIVELMGGELKVESALGIGSRFYFDITFKTVDADESGTVSKPEIGDTEKPMFSAEILVCEDNEMNRRVIQEHLSRVGIKTVTAENGRIGVDTVQKRIDGGGKMFDLIFMDMHMPVMDGLEAAAEILKLNTGVPIVALTANIMSHDRELYHEGGLSDYLGKPFKSQELWRCLLKYLTPEGVRAADESADDELQKQLEAYFVRDNQNTFADISAALGAGDIKLAHRLAHTLKSCAGQIGKVKLQKAAADVEDALKDGEDNTAPELLGSFEKELDAVLLELAPLLEKPESVPDAPRLDGENALKLLERLEPLLKSGNPECLEMLDELRGIEGAEKMAELMEDFDFEPALEQLVSIRAELEGR